MLCLTPSKASSSRHKTGSTTLQREQGGCSFGGYGVHEFEPHSLFLSSVSSSACYSNDNHPFIWFPLVVCFFFCGWFISDERLSLSCTLNFAFIRYCQMANKRDKNSKMVYRYEHRSCWKSRAARRDTRSSTTRSRRKIAPGGEGDR